MLRKFFTFVSIILCSLFLTGCIDIKVADEYTVNEDLSVDHTFEILVGNNMYAFANRINEGLYENLSDSGYSNIIDAYDSDSFGKKGTKHIELNGEIGSALSNQYVSITDNSQDYFIFKHVDIIANIDFQNILNNNANSDLINFTEYKLTLNIPTAFTDTNAQNVYNEGKSATWHFVPKNGNGTVHFECNVPNKKNIQVLLIGTAVIFGFIILVKVLSYAFSAPKYSNTIKCPNCGFDIKYNDLFCGNCGCKLKETQDKNEV